MLDLESWFYKLETAAVNYVCGFHTGFPVSFVGSKFRVLI